MNKVVLYYFSGTGNSLYAVKQLQQGIPEAGLIPIIRYLDKEAVSIDAETMGFIFPVYFATVPAPVKNFIKKLNLSSTKYIFPVATRGGTTHRAFTDINKVLKNRKNS